MANCIHCKKPIKLVPSAAERAKAHGGVARDYEKLFIAHANCTIDYRKKLVNDFLSRNT